MRVYLDCCAYNRPYDDLSNIVINMEAQAKLHIQGQIRNGEYNLATSEMLLFEVNECPFEVRQNGIMEFIGENSSVHVGPNNNAKIDEDAREIMRTGIKYKDACHVASALLANCDYFITTDKRLLKYKNEHIKIVSPIKFIEEREGNENDR